MLRTDNPAFKARVEERFSVNHFSKDIGFQLKEIEVGYVSGELVMEERHWQQNQFAHGGVIMTLCDIVTGFAAFTLVGPDKHVMTVEMKTSFLSPGKGEKLIAKGRVIKPGSRFHFCEAEVYSYLRGREKLVAKATTTMVVKEVV